MNFFCAWYWLKKFIIKVNISQGCQKSETLKKPGICRFRKKKQEIEKF